MKNVILTGVSGGMGLATAKRLTNNRYHVFGLDIKEPAEKLANLTFIRVDLRNKESVDLAVNEVKKDDDEIDAIISLAGLCDLISVIEV